jgi:hypothetical protein
MISSANGGLLMFVSALRLAGSHYAAISRP